MENHNAPEFDSFKTPYSDIGNAVRFVHHFGDRVRYCSEWASWLIWNGARWCRDRDDEVIRLAHEAAKELLRECAEQEDADLRQRHLRWALVSQSDARLTAMLRQARSMRPVAILPEALDADPMLLNCANGTLDLRTMELRPHNRTDLITRILSVGYDLDSKAPTWEAFLSRVTGGDAEVAAYIRRAVGYTLTGGVTEQVLFFLHGSGANGKSTFLTAIMSLLADYARQADPELLVTHRGEVHPSNVADLAGARMVVCVEVDEGRRMAEVMVKQLTGGDRIKARRMHRDWFEFEPTFKVWLAANHRPEVRGTDEAIWRRIRLIPFTQTIPESERDRGLQKSLSAELAGILSWAVRGCAEWMHYGLGSPPEAVVMATSEYRAEMDIVAEFLTEGLLSGPDRKYSVSGLHADYVSWCKQRAEYPLTRTSFNRRLVERGLMKTRGTQGRWFWRGIGPLSEASFGELAQRALNEKF